MDSNIQRKLLQVIHENYPVGSPWIKNWNDTLQKVVEDKIDDKSESVISWNTLINKLRDKGLSIQNLSHLQFPNLMLIVGHSETFQNVTIYKNLAVCLSLLCPFYTYYYEYKHKVRIGEGLLPFNNFVFHSQKNFESLKIFVPLKDIESTLNYHFPGHSFISHYSLMMNKISSGFPYGVSSINNDNLEYSFYQFLFNSEQPNSNSIFQ